MKKIFLFLVLVIVTVKAFSQADEYKRTIGLTATVQQGNLGIMLPIWFSTHFMLAPSVSLIYAENVGTDFSFGLTPRYYFKSEKFAPYIGANLAVAVLDKNLPGNPNFPTPPKKETTVDYIAGAAFGAEYFFVPQFSAGVEAQGNFSKSDKKSNRFGNPGNLNFNLGTMATVSVYF